MALRDSMRDSAAAYLRPGETVQAVLGAQTASQLVAAVSGVFLFLGLNHYRIVAVSPRRRGRAAAIDPARPANGPVARNPGGWGETPGSPPLLQGHRDRRQHLRRRAVNKT